jgi:hypothetical protein
MDKNEIQSKVEALNIRDFELGFPHDDCNKITHSLPDSNWIKADLNTFCHSLWSLSATPKLLKLGDEELGKYKIWLEKSFFERFPQYLSVKAMITEENTPDLCQTLKINEELREVLKNLIILELEERKY